MSTKIEVAEICKKGKQIILPEGMSYDSAIDTLERRKEYEEQTIEIAEKIDCFVWDGALALSNAIREMFGWAEAKAEQSFFGKNPPKMIQIEIGVEETTLVPWGRFSLPGIDGYIQTLTATKNGRLIFALNAVVKRKHQNTITELVALTKELVKKQSVYRGKAIKMRFYDEHGERTEMPMPSFIDVSGIKSEEIIFSENVETHIVTNLLTPIRFPDVCRKHKIPLKRGILLSGKYGVGKTLVANMTAKTCIENGWTFLLCERADEIADMIDFAKQYQPSVVFCEDIDRVVEGDRGVEMDEILNIIDGIESKKTEIIVVLTTNHVENIHKAMLRPGRLDAIVNVLPPDSEAVGKLVRLYSRGLLEEDADLSEVGLLLAGQIPAVIKECVERSKLYAVHTHSGGELQIGSQDIVHAASSMTEQLELLNGKEVVSNKDHLTMKLINLLSEERKDTVKCGCKKEEEENE